MEQLELFPANTATNISSFFTIGTVSPGAILTVGQQANLSFNSVNVSWPSYTTDQVRELLDVVTSRMFWIYQDPGRLKDLENLKSAYENYLMLAKLTLGDDFVKLMQTL